MRIEPILDPELVRKTLTSPSVWTAMADDGFVKPEAFVPSLNDWNWFLGVWDGDEYLGMFMVYQVNGIMCEAHVALLPNCGGFRAVKAGELMKAWTWQNTPFKRIITSVPSCNKLGLKYAKLAGLTEHGLNPGSWLKNGQLHDLHLFGVSHG